MALVRLHKKGQMTLPQGVRNQLGLEEGDLFEVEVQEDAIVLHPKKLVDTSQAYFWSEVWQAGERQASEDIAEGRTIRLPNAQEAIAHLREAAARRRPG